MSNSNQQITTPTHTGPDPRPFKLSLFGRIRRWAYQRAVRNGLNDKQLLNLPPTPEYIYCATTLGVAEKINYDLPSNNWICIVNHPGQLEIKTALLLLGTHQRIIAKRSSQSSLQVTLNKYLLNEMFIYTDQIDTPEKMREIIGTEIAQGTLYTIAIEGTRNYGIGLRRGQPGIVRILSSVPNINILPVAVYMDEYDDSMLSTFFKKSPPWHISVGKGFKVNLPKDKLPVKAVQEVADEITLRLAANLPEHQRGFYRGVPIKYKYTESLI